MQLEFEYTKEWWEGGYPIFLHSPDNSIVSLYHKDNNLVGRSGEYVEHTPNDTVFTDPIVVATEVAEGLSNTHLIGGFNWITWKSGDKHRVALYPESSKVMKEAFMKGFLLGVQIRHVAVKRETLGDILSLVPEAIKDNNANIDFYNGFIVGVTI